MLRSVSALVALAVSFQLSGCKCGREPVPAQVVEPVARHAAGARKPWGAGPLRSSTVTIPFGLRLMGRRDHAAAAALVRKLAVRHLPGIPTFDLAAKPYPSPPALGIGAAPPEAVGREAVRLFGRGIDQAAEARLAKPWPFTVLVLLVQGEKSRTALKDLTALVAEAAESLDAVVEDAEARLYYSAHEFAGTVARGGFEGDLPVVMRHVAIHSYETDGGTIRSVTVGMSKLGLPDVVVNGHAAHGGESMQALIGVVAQTLAERDDIDVAGRLEVDLRSLRSRTAREAQLASLKKGATARESLSVAVGTREEGDAENRLMELTFEGKPGSAVERQEAVLTAMFGAEEEVRAVEHDEELLAESARARARLLALKPAWLRGHAVGEQLMVKAPFRTASGGNEWMWIEVTGWQGTSIRGLLANDPLDVKGLRAGATVEVEEASVFDYLHRSPDGTVQGNTTQDLLRRR